MALKPGKNSDNGDKPNKNDKSKQAEDDAFLREVDDALRDDQIQGFFKNYGIILAVVIIGGLLAFAGWLWYSGHQKEQAGVTGDSYTLAMDAVRRNNLNGASEAFKGLNDADQKGYRYTSRLMTAAIAAEQQKGKEAASQYAAIAKDDSAPQVFRDLALIRQTLLEYDDMKPDAVVARLKHLAVPGNAWFGTAGELVALAHMRAGKNDLACLMFKKMSEDENVPESIRNRARQMAGLMGIDSVDDADLAAGSNTPNAAAPAAPAGVPAQ